MLDELLKYLQSDEFFVYTEANFGTALNSTGELKFTLPVELRYEDNIVSIIIHSKSRFSYQLDWDIKDLNDDVVKQLKAAQNLKLKKSIYETFLKYKEDFDRIQLSFKNETTDDNMMYVVFSIKE